MTGHPVTGRVRVVGTDRRADVLLRRGDASARLRCLVDHDFKTGQQQEQERFLGECHDPVAGGGGQIGGHFLSGFDIAHGNGHICAGQRQCAGGFDADAVAAQGAALASPAGETLSPAEAQALTLLAGIDPDTLTPREALDALYKLKAVFSS